MTDFLNYLILGLTRGSMYALIALGYTLVYGVLQLINFAHSEVFMSGAFGSYHRRAPDRRATASDASGLGSAGRPARSACSPARSSAPCVAWMLERVAYRPLRKRGAPKLAFLISAIGVSFFLVAARREAVQPVQRQQPFRPTSRPNETLFTTRRGHVTLLQVVIIVSAVLMMFFLDRLVSGTKLGRSIRGVAEDAPTAALMGIDIDRTISRTFIIGGALAGAAGFLFGTRFVLLQHDGLHPGHQGLRGGRARRHRQHPRRHARRPAARHRREPRSRPHLVGGLIGIEWTDVVAFVVLVLVLVFRPTGILGERLGRAA